MIIRLISSTTTRSAYECLIACSRLPRAFCVRGAALRTVRLRFGSSGMRRALLGSSGLLGLPSLWCFSVFFPRIACIATSVGFFATNERALLSRSFPAGYLHR